jgi:hypothetical protein
MGTPAEPQQLTVINASGTFTMPATDFAPMQSTTGEWDVIVFNGGSVDDPAKVGAFSGVEAVYWSAQASLDDPS